MSITVQVSRIGGNVAQVSYIGAYSPGPIEAGATSAGRQSSARTASGNDGTYNEDLIAWARGVASVGSGTYNENLIQALQTKLGSSSTNISDLLAEAAADRGKDRWDQVADDLDDIGS